MFHLDELLRVKPTVEAIENISALENGRIGETAYIVEKTIHRSNDCFVYYGKNSLTNQTVIIKEFFPMIDFSYMGLSIRLQRKNREVRLSEEAVESIRVLNNLKKYYKESSLMMKRLSSKYVVNVLDVFECYQTIYTVIEYIPYPTLDQFIEHKKLYPNQAKSLFEMIMHSIDAIHSKYGVIKTLSPTNIYVTEHNVVIGDFNGLKRSYFVSDNDGDIFIAPEVTSGEILTEAADCYSLGKILEYLLGHAELYDTTIHKKMYADRLSYLIRKSSERHPIDRIQNVDELQKILDHKIIDKSKKFDVLRAFLVIFLVMFAIFMVRKSGIIQMIPFPKDSFEIVQESEKISDFKLITKRDSFEFGEKKVVRWVDCQDSHNFVVYLQGDGIDYSLLTQVTAIDLSGFCLNPGLYKMHITNEVDEVLTHEFEVIKDNQYAGGGQPEIDLRDYSFYEYEDKRVSWYAPSMVRVVILDLKNLEIIDDMFTEQLSYDFGKTLNRGDYVVSVQTITDEMSSSFTHIYVKIYSDDELKAPILSINDGKVFKKDELLEWQPFEGGSIHLRLVHEEGSFVTFEAESSKGFVQLNDTLIEGQYEVFVTHVLDNRSSHIVKKSILFEK